jgi:3-deoxy-D-manno-octulosonate 8-phosphate phosphatase KdsC-like HAD superfamily phosphatase
MRITAKSQLDKIKKPKDLFEKLNMLNMRRCEKIEKRLGELKREVKFVNQSFLNKSGIITELLNEAEVTFKIGNEGYFLCKA